MITPNHPFCGKPVCEASMTADFVPLYIETACQTIHGWNLLEASLSAGDILYLTMPATKLEQLWRVAPFQVAVSLDAKLAKYPYHNDGRRFEPPITYPLDQLMGCRCFRFQFI